MAIYALELTEISRGFWKKARESPLLYTWFSVIMVFSVIMSGYLTLYGGEASLPLDMDQIFFVVFFLFMLKSTADFHRYFVTSKRLEYLLSAPISHTRVAMGVFMAIFWINLGLWALFSSSYILILSSIGIDVGYPWLYLRFTLGVVLSVIIGVEIGVHFFSRSRYLMAFPVLFITSLWYHRDIDSILLIILISSMYLMYALKLSHRSFGFISRKERRAQIKERMGSMGPAEAMAWKEMRVLWRENLITSFLFTSVSVGIGSGYLGTHMDIALIPLRIRPFLVPVLPLAFLFLGTFIISSYLFIFPTLNAFLAEEDTMWILKHLPISGSRIVKGKVMAMCLPLLTSLPFPFFFVLFTGAHYLYPGFAMLFLSFFLATAISLPFGIRYAGKKSDVMLLYSISVMFFAIFSAASYITIKLIHLGIPGFFVIIGLIFLASIFLFVSMKLSGEMMDRKWNE